MLPLVHLAEKLKMTVRGVQVWFQNRRAKAKAQKMKMAKKNSSTASSPSESEKNTTSTPNDTTTENTTENVNTQNETTEGITEKTVNSPPAIKDVKDETKPNSLDMDNKLKIENKDYPLLTNAYFQVDDEANQGMVPFTTETTPEYFFDKQESGLNQGFGPSPLHADFYSGAPINMNRSRCRAKSLPNVLQYGMYVSPQQQSLVSPLNQPIPFQGLHQHPQLSAQSYPLIGGAKSTTGSYSPQSLQFLRQKSPYSPNTFIYTQKAQSLPNMGPSNDSTASSPSISGSEKGSQNRISAGLAKHPDLFYNGIDGARGRGYVNYMASPGIDGNIPSPHSTASNSNVYSPSYQGFIPEVAGLNGIRPIDDSFGYSPYGINQQSLNNPYANNIQNFVPEINSTGAGVLQGISSYPNGFNPGRRSSCPPEFLASVNSLQLSLDENLTKQKGLETIKEDEGIE